MISHLIILCDSCLSSLFRQCLLLSSRNFCIESLHIFCWVVFMPSISICPLLRIYSQGLHMLRLPLEYSAHLSLLFCYMMSPTLILNFSLTHHELSEQSLLLFFESFLCWSSSSAQELIEFILKEDEGCQSTSWLLLVRIDGFEALGVRSSILSFH